MQFLAGGDVARSCISLDVLPSQYEVFKGLQEQLTGRKNNDINVVFCNGADLCNGYGAGLCNCTGTCNGSGRLADVSTMMILLPASLALLTSFFSRL
jgi:hypothetical protein